MYLLALLFYDLVPYCLNQFRYGIDLHVQVTEAPCCLDDCDLYSRSSKCSAMSACTSDNAEYIIDWVR